MLLHASTNPSLVEAAVAYGKRRIRVVPLHNIAAEGGCTCQPYRDQNGKGPCDNIGKHPRFVKFQDFASADEKIIRGWWLKWPEANIGIISGKDSNIWVLDMDPRNGGEESRDALTYKYGRSEPTLTTRTGGGGTHEYFTWPDFEIPYATSLGEDYPGIDIIGESHIVVAPPSKHWKGTRYEWAEAELSLEEIAPQPAPAWLLDLIRARVQPEPAAQITAAREGWPESDLAIIHRDCAWMRHCSEHAPMLAEPQWYGQLSIVGRCTNGEQLAHDLSRPHSGYNSNQTTAKLQHALRAAGPARCDKIRNSLGGERFCSACQHWGTIKSPVVLGIPGRARRVAPAELPKVTPAATAAAEQRQDPPQSATKSCIDVVDRRPEPPPSGEIVPKTAWQKRLIRKASGEPKPILANAVTALRTAPEWSGVLAWNEFSLTAVTQRAPIFGGMAGAWTDHEDRLCADWLQHAGILVSVEVAGQAVQAVARDSSFHPVRDYLTGLKWDGVKRLDGWLNLYLGAKVSDYCSAVGERYLRSAVARVMAPGCKVDCCLILEGEQGIRKSTALKTLGEPWFTDELADLGSKDAALQTRGIWLIEIAELDGMTRAEVGKIKAFMSRAVDRFRPPYGRHLLESPRQCVFAGSVNHGAYLRDDTGGRRFWPIACSRIRIEELARDRDQLWAEAYATYRAGIPWWLETPELNRLAEDEQSQRYEGSAWDALILDWAAGRIHMGEASISVAEVLSLCIQKREGEWTQTDETRVARCLSKAKWKRYRDRKRGMQWRYRPPEDVPTQLGTFSESGNTPND